MKDYHNTTYNAGRSPAYDRQQTVLLVDNEGVNLKYMSEVLRMSGYGVAVFYEAHSALHFSMRGVRKFDLVITEYHLPGINGPELAEALRRLHPDMPVILLAAHGDIDICSEVVSPRIFEYINKPIDRHELLGIVQEALGNGMPEEVPVVRESLMAHAEQCE